MAEASADSLKRIGLGKAHVDEDARYLISTNDDGEILWTPVASVPVREMSVWQDRALRESLTRGMKGAADGDLHDLGDFTGFVHAD